MFVTCDSVSQEGLTTVTTTSQATGSISGEYAVELDSEPPFFIDVETSAEVSGTTVVCVTFPELGDRECSLELLHRPDGSDEFLPATLARHDSNV